MMAVRFMHNKIKRQIVMNGQEMTFIRYCRDEYHQLTDEVEKEFNFNALFHEGGGYGGMLNFELYERDGTRVLSKLKPMVLALWEDSKEILIDDEVIIGSEKYKVVGTNDVKNLNICIEISMEKV